MISPTPSIHSRSNADKLAYSVIRIETDLGEEGVVSGTAFFHNAIGRSQQKIPLLVTCYHNIEGAVKGRVYLHGADQEGNPVHDHYFEVSIGTPANPLSRLWTHHPDPSVDLCAVPVSLLLKDWNKGQTVFYAPFENVLIPTEAQMEQLTAVEEILMVGYPDGQWDAVNALPFVRRGITATDPKRKREGREEFATDIACFSGSSGSPIILFNPHGYIERPNMSFVLGERFFLMGVHAEGYEVTIDGVLKSVASSKKQKPFISIPMNLGIAIHARRLRAFDDMFDTQ